MSIPADDGMGDLRARIKEIRDSSFSPEELGRGLQSIMSEKWATSPNNREYRIMLEDLASSRKPIPIPSRSTAFASSSDQPAFSSPTSIFGSPLAKLRLASLATSTDTPEVDYNITEADLVPSYVPLRRERSDIDDAEVVIDDEFDESETERKLGCKHYTRNVKVQCVTCQKWYPCRHCHNDAEGHLLPRPETKHMLCMICSTPQPASDQCRNCGEISARYFCDTCKLWDNDPNNRIYHCPDCGLCRRGEGLGKDLVHCKNCTVCILIQHYPTHRCLPRATDRDCPICFQYMFTSSDSIVAMPCGHYLHQKCYKEYMRHEYRCPICKRSAVNMELQWRKLDEAIERQPMPSEYASSDSEDDDNDNDSSVSGGSRLQSEVDQPSGTTSPAYPTPTSTRLPRPRIPRTTTILCNDCGTRSEVPFHWLGCKCAVCDSYNTDEASPISSAAANQRTGTTAAPMLVVDRGNRPDSNVVFSAAHGPHETVKDPAVAGASAAEPDSGPAAGSDLTSVLPESWRPVSYLLNWQSRRSSNSISNAVNTVNGRRRGVSNVAELDEEEGSDHAGGVSLGTLPFAPFGLMQRVMGTSLSPIRNYLNEARSGVADSSAVEDVDGDWDGAELWGRAGWFLSGDEGDDRGEESESESEEEPEADDGEDDDDDEDDDYGGGGRLRGLVLIGHR